LATQWGGSPMVKRRHCSAEVALTITASCMQLSTPVHSNTASKPSERPSTAWTASEDLRPSQPVCAAARASRPLTRGPLGRR
jgi:hypothetical protein